MVSDRLMEKVENILPTAMRRLGRSSDGDLGLRLVLVTLWNQTTARPDGMWIRVIKEQRDRGTEGQRDAAHRGDCPHPINTPSTA